MSKCDFFRAYVTAALWSSHDDDDEPLDTNYDFSDVAPETRQRMREDCDRFQAENAALIAAGEPTGREWSTLEQAGHDFWLTRNGHGAGFWDRPNIWGKEGATKLSDASRAFGSYELMLGDDGLIYGM